MVKVYTITDCPWCKKVKTYLNSKQVAFTEVNIETDLAGRKKLAALSKEMTIPLTDIDGKIVIGFEKEILDEYLHLQ